MKQWVEFTQGVVVNDAHKGTLNEESYTKGERVELDLASAEHWRARGKCGFLAGEDDTLAVQAAAVEGAPKDGLDAIVAAIDTLDRGSETDFTKAGVPSAKALSMALGLGIAGVSRAARDDAWKVWQAREAAAAQ